MRRRFQGQSFLYLPLLLSFLPAWSALNFYTYRIQQNVVRANSNGAGTDSTYTSYELTRLGSVTLEASILNLTSHGSYLSVVEEATLTGNIENRPHDITGDFLFQGSLPIPALAAVHGFSVYHGDSVYAATLRKQVYSLDDRFLDSTELRSTLDGRVAFLQQLSDRSFEATFSHLTLEEPVRVRIRYDLPFPGAPGSQIRVPVVFHPSGAPPRQAQIAFAEKAQGYPRLRWLGPTGKVDLDDNGSHTLAYAAEYLFQRDEAPAVAAVLQRTGFAGGEAAGEYLLFNGGLTDSLSDILTRRMEVAFWWRWNPPFAFVEMQNGLKTLSAAGRLVAAEAKAMKQVITGMASHGHRFGLMHSIVGKDPVWLPPAEEGSDGYRELLDYLDGFTEQRLYADYKDYQDPRPDWEAAAWRDSGEVAAGRREFLEQLGTIRAGFGSDADILRHIELLGSGQAPVSEIDLKDPGPVEGILDSVTISHVFGSWLGVNLSASLRTKANEDLRPVTMDADLGFGPLTLMLPVFQPSSMEYRAFAGGRSYAIVMPFGSGQGREAVLKAGAGFADTLQLQGIDALGRKTRIHTLHPRMLRVEEDSGLARLWAADPDRISDRSEPDLGMRYGILSKGSYFAAGLGEGRLDPGSGVPLRKSIRMAGGGVFRVRGGQLVFASGVPAAAGGWLDVFDLRGRWLGRIDLAPFRTGSGFAIPLDRLARFGASRLVLILRGAGKARPFTLALGGRP